VRLVLVHGIAQGGRNPKDIEVEWLASLNEGLSRSGLSLPRGVEVKLPFYGDELDKLVREYDVPVSDEIAAKGGDIPNDYAHFRSTAIEEIRKKAGISDEQAQAEMGSDVNDKGVENWKWVQALVRIIDRRMTGVSGWTIEEFLRCVYLYTQQNRVRSRIDQIVSADLTDDSVVVGHSLGSVVGYNIMRSRSAPLPYVTVGSPLAIRAVRRTLGLLKNPAGARVWFNALDPVDVVSLYPLDSNNFGVMPAIVNHPNVANWTDNHHGIVGYLDDTKVAQAVRSGFNS
jgi:hypothetical protein